MKRAILFLCAALFILLVIEPNIASGTTPLVLSTPEYSEDDSLRTNDDVSRQISESKATIMVDPGRGGRDTGYDPIGQTAEKDVAMQVALSVGSALEKDGYNVVYSRWYDDITGCTTTAECDAQRLQKAKDENVDYILSIRFNQDTSLQKGYSIFTQPDNELLLTLSEEIADQIQAASYSDYEGLDTDHYASFVTLSDPNVPAVLIQLGYLTNQDDYSRITNSQYQNRLATAIAQAFLNTVN